jgi:hypothetical protein
MIMANVVIRRATAADLAAIVALLADDEIGVGRESPDDLTPYQRAFEVIESDKHEDAHRFYEQIGFSATHEGYKMPL